MGKKYNKVMDISFVVLTNEEDGATNEEIFNGLQRRAVMLSVDSAGGEIQESVGCSDEHNTCDSEIKIHEEHLEEVNSERQELIDNVLLNIQEDIEGGDLTAIEELVKFIPSQFLKGYLPEPELDAV